MSAPVKLTTAQRRALEYIGARKQVTTGYLIATVGHGIGGSTFRALASRGLVTADFTALMNTTTYAITDAGRAALKAEKQK